MFSEPLSWSCHICGKDRPDAAISVFLSDLSDEMKLPPGTVTQNVRYCNDDPKCTQEARVFRFL